MTATGNVEGHGTNSYSDNLPTISHFSGIHVMV